MHGGINVTENLEDEEKSLNNPEPTLNRGVELLLRRREKPKPPKTFESLGMFPINSKFVILTSFSSLNKKSKPGSAFSIQTIPS